jgi:hypothetical protein
MLRACQPDLGFFGFEAYFAHQAWLSDETGVVIG